MTQRTPIRTVMWLLVGAGVVFGGIVAIVFFAQSSLQVRFEGREAAFAEMDRVRGRFERQVPCLDRPRGRVPDSREGVAPTQVHMLAWEREDRRLVRVVTPYWALRAGSWKINAARVLAPPLEHVAWRDLDACGPGLILDRRSAGGGRVVIWME